MTRDMTRRMDSHLAPHNQRALAGFAPAHVGWAVHGGVGVVTLNRPERKNH